MGPDMNRINNLINHADQVIDHSFGQLAQVKVGNKLWTWSNKSDSSDGFEVEVKIDQAASGVKRTGWNLLSSAASYLPEKMQIAKGAIDTNTDDITKTIGYLGSTLKELQDSLEKMDPQAQVSMSRKIGAIQEKVVNSREGLYNLLLTYIIDRMPNKNELTKEAPLALAKVFAGALIEMNLVEFEELRQFQMDPKKNEMDPKIKNKMIEQILKNTSEVEIRGVRELLGDLDHLDHYFPVKDTHIDQLRGIGKLIKEIDKVQQQRATLYEAFNRLAEDEAQPAAAPLQQIVPAHGGERGPDGRTYYPNGSYFNPEDNRYHYKEYVDVHPFTDKQIETLNKEAYRKPTGRA